MRGCERPAASPAVAQLVARMLDGGAPLDEAEIVQLFQARGADFEVQFPNINAEMHCHSTCEKGPRARWTTAAAGRARGRLFCAQQCRL